MPPKRKRGGNHSRRRIRAHANPLSDVDVDCPFSPEYFDWSQHYPAFSQDGKCSKQVTIADVGCGFGGLLSTLAPIFPEKLILGLEIRDRVVEIVQDTITDLRAKAQATPSEQNPVGYQNISVVRTNIMKYAPNYFYKGQLEKMFFCFPDPHFKRSNHRRRVISPTFLAMYAYCLKEGGLLYTISDVKDLHDWMVKHLSEHPLFERVSDEELVNDPCIDAMTNGTQEGQKVTRIGGSKYPAVFRRKPSKACADLLTYTQSQ